MDIALLIIIVGLCVLIFLLVDIAVIAAYFIIHHNRRKLKLLNFSINWLRNVPLPGIETILRDQNLQKASPEMYRAVRNFYGFIRGKGTKKRKHLTYYMNYLMGMEINLPGSEINDPAIVTLCKHLETMQARLLNLSRHFLKVSESGRVGEARGLLSQIDMEMPQYSKSLLLLLGDVQRYRVAQRERIAKENTTSRQNQTEWEDEEWYDEDCQRRRRMGLVWYLNQQSLDRADSWSAFRDNIPGPFANNEGYQQHFHGASRPWGPNK